MTFNRFNDFGFRLGMRVYGMIFIPINRILVLCTLSLALKPWSVGLVPCSQA
jgi:hypothetical protein